MVNIVAPSKQKGNGVFLNKEVNKIMKEQYEVEIIEPVNLKGTIKKFSNLIAAQMYAKKNATKFFLRYGSINWCVSHKN